VADRSDAPSCCEVHAKFFGREDQLDLGREQRQCCSPTRDPNRPRGRGSRTVRRSDSPLPSAFPMPHGCHIAQSRMSENSSILEVPFKLARHH
jgi:hypothetical protein